jgi:hypothetical protein
MHDKLIWNLYALLCWRNFIIAKSGCYNHIERAKNTEADELSKAMA